MSIFYRQANRRKRKKKLSTKQYSICVNFYRQEHSRIKKAGKMYQQSRTVFHVLCKQTECFFVCLAFNYQRSCAVLLAFFESIFTSKQIWLSSELYSISLCLI